MQLLQAIPAGWCSGDKPGKRGVSQCRAAQSVAGIVHGQRASGRREPRAWCGNPRPGLSGVHSPSTGRSASGAACGPIWRTCELSVIHGGQDIGFQPPFTPATDYAELSRRPELAIIIAHLGGWRNWDGWKRLGQEKCVQDLLCAAVHAGPKAGFPVVRQHGADKVLSADSPWQDLASGVRCRSSR